VYVLEVLSGPLDGKTWAFENEITIGRDEAIATACVWIDRYISRRHARLWDDDGKLFLADLSSKNGTRLDGRDVVAAAPIEVGERFVCGRTLLRVVRDEPSSG
jgi:pSer/pThr/pTyr-binding forkhead associated (FHA) protein